MGCEYVLDGCEYVLDGCEYACASTFIGAGFEFEFPIEGAGVGVATPVRGFRLRLYDVPTPPRGGDMNDTLTS